MKKISLRNFRNVKFTLRNWSFDMMQLPSECHIFLISAPNHTRKKNIPWRVRFTGVVPHAKDIAPIFSLFTNLKAKESCNWWLTRSILGFRQQKSDVKYLPMSVANIGMLQGPFRKRKWCLRDFANTQEGLRDFADTQEGLRDFADTQEGLRNHFAAKGYSRRAAKLASILRFPASSLRHILGNFRRKYTILYKKAAKSLRNKRVISQHFAKCFLQLGVIDLQWL
uniref:Uncharacterized protein n=1 Tax=Vitis vinifera TaxID=29760 RepID=A5AWB7_VITVI|nr:hypothetical protein VITISV_017420 [Vitis vinifera]